MGTGRRRLVRTRRPAARLPIPTADRPEITTVHCAGRFLADSLGYRLPCSLERTIRACFATLLWVGMGKCSAGGRPAGAHPHFIVASVSYNGSMHKICKIGIVAKRSARKVPEILQHFHGAFKVELGTGLAGSGRSGRFRPMPISISKYQIESNTDEKWTGQTMIIFYEKDLHPVS